MSLKPVDDEGFVQCEDCDTVFLVVFNRNPVYHGIEYCPFCGCEVDIDEVSDEHET